jgi:ABC-type thiamin/hydroxymethylpyrimidine transport system permease subunit
VGGVAPAKPYRFSTRDLLVIAVLSGLGGIMSTYVGYLGTLLNNLLGVPFGAGQFVSGLHVFWIVLAAGLVRPFGAGSLCGLVKGSVELLTGSTHGAVIVIVSLVQGLVVDLFLALMGGARKRSVISYVTGGAVASAANVIVFQLIYFSGAPWGYLVFITFLSLVSGALFAGGFGYSVLTTVHQVRPSMMREAPVSAPSSPKSVRYVTVALAIALTLGAGYYFTNVYEAPWKGAALRVEGNVEKPLTLDLSRLEKKTITAELKGQVTYVAPKEYTGVLVSDILGEAVPKPGSETVTVVASDGYEVDFDLAKVMDDDRMLVIEEGDTLRLVAGDYEGGYWVQKVSKLVVK